MPSATGLGVNHHPDPGQCAWALPFHSYHRDGAMGWTATRAPSASAQQLRLGEQPDYREPPLSAEGADHWNHRVDEDSTRSPAPLPPDCPRPAAGPVRQHGRPLGGACEIQERHVANCSKADPAYGAGKPPRPWARPPEATQPSPAGLHPGSFPAVPGTAGFFAQPAADGR